MGIEYGIREYGLAIGVLIFFAGITGMMVRAFIKYLNEERADRQAQVADYKTLAENHISHNTQIMQDMINQVKQMGTDSCREHGEIKSKLDDLK